MAEGYSNRYLEQIRAARKAAEDRGRPTKWKPTAGSGARKAPIGYGEISSGNPDLDQANEAYASTRAEAEALGNPDASKGGEGDKSFIEKVLGVLEKPLDIISQPLFAQTETALTNASTSSRNLKEDSSLLSQLGEATRAAAAAQGSSNIFGLASKLFDSEYETADENLGSKNQKLTPGSILKGEGNAVPRWRQMLEEAGQDTSDLEDEDLLRSFALLRPEEDDNFLDKAGNFIAGTAIDIVSDPLTYATMGTGGVVSGAARGGARAVAGAARTAVRDALAGTGRTLEREAVEAASREAAQSSLEAAQRLAAKPFTPSVTEADFLAGKRTGLEASQAAKKAGYNTGQAPEQVGLDVSDTARQAASNTQDALASQAPVQASRGTFGAGDELAGRLAPDAPEFQFLTPSRLPEPELLASRPVPRRTPVEPTVVGEDLPLPRGNAFPEPPAARRVEPRTLKEAQDFVKGTDAYKRTSPTRKSQLLKQAADEFAETFDDSKSYVNRAQEVLRAAQADGARFSRGQQGTIAKAVTGLRKSQAELGRVTSDIAANRASKAAVDAEIVSLRDAAKVAPYGQKGVVRNQVKAKLAESRKLVEDAADLERRRLSLHANELTDGFNRINDIASSPANRPAFQAAASTVNVGRQLELGAGGRTLRDMSEELERNAVRLTPEQEAAEIAAEEAANRAALTESRMSTVDGLVERKLDRAQRRNDRWRQQYERLTERERKVWEKENAEALSSAQRAVNDIIPQTPREMTVDTLADAAEKGFMLKGGRGVRQEVQANLTEMGFSADEAAQLTREIVSSIQGTTNGALGGLGLVNPLTNTRLLGTAGAGVNVDRLGLGGLAEAAYSVQNLVRSTRAYRFVADRMNGRYGQIMGDFLRSSGSDADFAAFKAKRASMEASNEMLGTFADTARNRLASVTQLITDGTGRKAKVNPEMHRALTDLFGNPEADISHLSAAQQQAVRAAHQEVKDTFEEFGIQLADLQESIGLITPAEAAELRKFARSGNFQPRVMTDASAAERQRVTVNHAGVQRKRGYSPGARKPGMYETDVVDDLTGDIADQAARPMTNMEANAAELAAGGKNEFLTDPIELLDKYSNSIGYTFARLRQVDVLKKAGLLKTIPDTGVEKGWAAVGGAATEGRTLTESVAKMMVPENMAEEVGRLVTASRPRIDNYMTKFFDSFMGGWKTWATTARGPGYHVRNGIGLAWQNYLAGVTGRELKWQAQIMRASAKNTKAVRDFLLTGQGEGLSPALRDAASQLTAAKGNQLTLADLDQLLDASMRESLGSKMVDGKFSLYDAWSLGRRNQVTQDNRLLEDLGMDRVTAGNLTRDPNTATLFRNTAQADRSGFQRQADRLVNNWWVRLNSDLAQGFETYGRGSAFIKGLRRFGVEDAGETASGWTKALHFDYDDLSEFERNFVKRFALPFYTFSRNNIPSQLLNLVNQPGKFAALYHMQENMKEQFGAAEGSERDALNDILPDWVRERGGFISNLGTDQAPIGIMLESPATDLNKVFDLDGVVGVNWEELVNMSNPLIKAGVETVAEKDLQTGASLEGTRDTPWYLGPLGSGAGESGNKQVPAAIANLGNDLIPFLGQIDRVTGGLPDRLMGRESRQKDRLWGNLATNLVGAPVMTYDQKQQEQELRRRENDLDASNRSLAFSQGLDRDEQSLIREAIRAGYDDAYIQELIEALRNN